MRILPVPFALLGLLAAVLVLAAGFANLQGLATALAALQASPVLRVALIEAAWIAVLALPIGLLLALGLWRAGPLPRTTAFALAVLVLLVPTPMHALLPVTPITAMSFAAAIIRGAAVALLILSARLRRLPPGLAVAARAAGAGWLQAWRHAVLAPLAWPMLAAAVCVFLLTLATGALGAAVAPHIDLAGAWTIPAALLLAVASIAALRPA